MKPITAKQIARFEKKKMKIAAFIEIAKLNEMDREQNLKHAQLKNSFDDRMNNLINTLDPLSPIEPEPKRIKIINSSSDSDEKLPDINSKPCLEKTQEELARLKEAQKRHRLRYKTKPRFRLKAVGENASIDTDPSERIPIFLSDIQHLLLYSQLGHHSPYWPSRWCQLDKFNRLTHTVVMVVENISLYHYMSYQSMFPFLNETFKSKVEIITPMAYNGSLIQDLAAVPLTGTQRSKLIKKFGNLDSAMQIKGELFQILKAVYPINSITTRSSNTNEKLPTTDKYSRTLLLLSAWQLVEENYPIPLKGALSQRYADYVLTKDKYEMVTPFSPMFGLDCEMCRTTTGNLEVTRISLVNEKFESIYEELVMPDNKIIDYLTRYSGITKKTLDGVTKKLKDVQDDLRSILPPDAILVGQSLNFDLHSLKMMHPYIIDTSVIFNLSGDRMKKTKLQTLAREFLSEKIQEGNKGHCSIEDSLASIKLAQLKLANYIEYGDAVLAGRSNFEKRNAHEQEKEYATSLFKHLTVAEEKQAIIIGRNSVMTEYNNLMFKSNLNNKDNSAKLNPKIHCETMDSNKAVVKRATEVCRNYSFSIGHVTLSEDQVQHDNALKTFRKLNKWITRVWNSMDVNSMCVVIFSGQNSGSSGVGFVQLKPEMRA